jgi:hypothetical protein
MPRYTGVVFAGANKVRFVPDADVAAAAADALVEVHPGQLAASP